MPNDIRIKLKYTIYFYHYLFQLALINTNIIQKKKINKMDDKHCCIGDDEEELGNMIINEVDGLPSLLKNYQDDLDLDNEEDRPDPSARTLDDLIHDEDLPTSVIVTNVDPRVFIDDDIKVIFLNPSIIIIFF